ncbi:uncharacterized protein LOC143862969 [Tasmannia lanceolata]|uniref:uncharacterized protein LOC143859587 n=1 Tax=Tasmannia lanceolata TaxID=3420 RepID=UPI0040647625
MGKLWKILFSNHDQGIVPTKLDLITPVAEEQENLKLHFNDDETLESEAKWANCLVGYFIGRRPFFISLCESLLRRWQISGNLQMYYLDHGFIIFKFSSAADCTRILEEAGQHYGGRPLILQRWDPDSSLQKKQLPDILVWVRLPGLHLKFWSQHGLSRIASLIGKPLYMDTQTAEATRLNYARMCIQISAKQVLPSSITLKTSSKEIIQPIIYNWRPKACTNCWDFSHCLEDCPTSIPSHSRKEWRPVSRVAEGVRSSPINPDLPKSDPMIGSKVLKENILSV